MLIFILNWSSRSPRRSSLLSFSYYSFVLLFVFANINNVGNPCRQSPYKSPSFSAMVLKNLFDDNLHQYSLGLVIWWWEQRGKLPPTYTWNRRLRIGPWTWMRKLKFQIKWKINHKSCFRSVNGNKSLPFCAQRKFQFHLANAKNVSFSLLTRRWKKSVFFLWENILSRTFINYASIILSIYRGRNRSDVKNKIPYTHWVFIKNEFFRYAQISLVDEVKEEARNFSSLYAQLFSNFREWIFFHHVCDAFNNFLLGNNNNFGMFAAFIWVVSRGWERGRGVKGFDIAVGWIVIFSFWNF